MTFSLFEEIIRSMEDKSYLVVLFSLGALWIICNFVYKSFIYFWEKVYPKMSKNNNKNDDTSQIKNGTQSNNFETPNNFEKICKSRVENIASKLLEEKEEKLVKKNFEIYQMISNLREKYASKMATAEDLEKIRKDVRRIDIELAKLKGEINKKEE